jgi:oxaloacetate decarboxylase gamma subunit
VAVNELLVEALRLMGVGMGIVLAFLLLLVGVLRVMSALAGRLAPPSPLIAAPETDRPAPEGDAELVAVISAAVARYRKSRRPGG